MLMAKDFLLDWSRLSPSPFLARVLATGYGTDLLTAAEQASRDGVAAKPHLASNVARVRQIYESWLKDTRIALSIAWTRCRAHDIRIQRPAGGDGPDRGKGDAKSRMR